MKLCFLITVIFLAAIAQPATPQQTHEPLNKNQVMTLVKAGMETSELIKLIHDHGIDFELAGDYLQALSKAGAQDAVIQALRAARPKLLTEDQVMQLVVGHVPSQRAAALVMQHGIDFFPGEEYLKTLRLAGADDTLITALSEASKAVAADLVVTTSPNAEVYLDGELQGHANAQGELELKARLGAHALKVTLAGKKDFQQRVYVVAQHVVGVEARLEDVGPPPPGTVRENAKDGLKYAWIPPGTFMMGCSAGDSACDGDEKPAHQVNITKGFWMGQTDVTVGAYKHFTAATGRQMPAPPSYNSGWANDSMPIVNVKWNEAHDYCTWAGGRLPSEAEWELAARAGSTEAIYGPIDEIAWHSGNSGGQAHEVAQKRANGYGLFDMLGNVWEWVNDWYDQNYYQNSPSQDPPGAASGTQRVLRGGSFPSPARVVRVSYCNRKYPADGYDYLGFRCARDVDIP